MAVSGSSSVWLTPARTLWGYALPKVWPAAAAVTTGATCPACSRLTVSDGGWEWYKSRSSSSTFFGRREFHWRSTTPPRT